MIRRVFCGRPWVYGAAVGPLMTWPWHPRPRRSSGPSASLTLALNRTADGFCATFLARMSKSLQGANADFLTAIVPLQLWRG